MNEPQKITVERLAQYSDNDAVAIGRLLTQLTARYDGAPVDTALLRDIIDSPYHDMLVARLADDTIVGTATVSITFGPVDHRRAWLEDFVVDSSIRSSGIGSKLWDAILDWCRQHQATRLAFTSRANKTAAQEFYLKRGAVIKDTNYFTKDIETH